MCACARVWCVCLQCDFPFLSLAWAQLSSGRPPPPFPRRGLSGTSGLPSYRRHPDSSSAGAPPSHLGIASRSSSNFAIGGGGGGGTCGRSPAPRPAARRPGPACPGAEVSHGRGPAGAGGPRGEQEGGQAGGRAAPGGREDGPGAELSRHFSFPRRPAPGAAGRGPDFEVWGRRRRPSGPWGPVSPALGRRGDHPPPEISGARVIRPRRAAGGAPDLRYVDGATSRDAGQDLEKFACVRYHGWWGPGRVRVPRAGDCEVTNRSEQRQPGRREGAFRRPWTA